MINFKYESVWGLFWYWRLEPHWKPGTEGRAHEARAGGSALPPPPQARPSPTWRKCGGCGWACAGFRGDGWEVGKLGCSPISRTGVEAPLVVCTSGFWNTAWLCGYLFSDTQKKDLYKNYWHDIKDTDGKRKNRRTSSQRKLCEHHSIHAVKTLPETNKQKLPENLCKSYI